ncbi:serine hydrolase domain-containing protein [Pseudoalteromonas sp. PA2MD11]|uniref:serine hydrolase domain-containing protein n=1 Tax=Pseudoalteromonas sp. PA2MD11 TaxID=2785057 RepID=UPI001ADEFC1A|nr:serine hydrolase domain-containing protein [Pseudoalteromonas sp. PA2MD11]
MKIFYIVLILSSLVSHFPAFGKKLISKSELSIQIEQALHRESLVGVVWSTVSEDEIELGAKGLADSDLQMETDNKVQSGSIVKTLIATGVLHLVTEGKLSLDTPVDEILSDIDFKNSWSSTTPVRVRHLLDHTSGLEDIRLWQLLTTKAEPDTALQNTIDPHQLHIRNRPGSRLSYSNIGYALLGMVIEAVVNERYEIYLDKQLLAPLGMHMSTFKFVSQEGPFRDPMLAMGHFENGVSQVTLPMYLRPAGQFTTTANDMALFARFLMGDGRVNGRVLIESSLLKSMGKPFKTEAALNQLTDIGYAFGVTTRDRHGVVGKCHSGSTLGYRTNFCYFPNEQKAFFIAFNADIETADYKQFDDMLINHLDIKKYKPLTPSSSELKVDEWQGFYTLSPTRMKRFEYFDQLLHFAFVSLDGSELVLKPFQGQKKILHPVGDNLFRDNTKRLASHALYISDNGKHLITDGFRTYEQTSLWLLVPMWLSLLFGLIGLLWILIYGAICLVLGYFNLLSKVLVPFLAATFLLVPLPLFFSQSFLRLGEVTVASSILAIATAILPFSMLYGLWRLLNHKRMTTINYLNGFAMFSILQWSVILIFWGVFPLKLWG